MYSYSNVAFDKNYSSTLKFSSSNVIFTWCKYCSAVGRCILRPMQTDATLLAINSQHCWAQQCCDLLRPFAWNHNNIIIAYSLKPVKLLDPCKRTQHCWPTTPNNVGSCQHLLRPFAWAFKALWRFLLFYNVHSTIEHDRFDGACNILW